MMNLPNKVLYTLVTSKKQIASWPYDEGDEYWQGGLTPKTYQWEIDLSVTSQSHSSPNTPTAFTYNGLDIYIGDWISDGIGRALKIIEVKSKTATSATVVVEDVERYNTFQDASGNASGDLTTNETFIFELDDEGMPKVNDIPSVFTKSNMFAALYGRFQRWNPLFHYMFKQLNHSLNPNDVVVLNPNSGLFEKYSKANNYPVIGSVVESLPNRFYVRPINKIVENHTPALPSSKGNYVYADDITGELSSNVSSKRVYLQLTDSSPSFVVGSVSAPILTSGSRFLLNGHELTVTSSSLADLLTLINDSTDDHNVTASEIAGETVAATVPSNLGYGIVGAILPLSAEINGTLVNFVTTESGSQTFGAGMADVNDMVVDINAAGIANIVASVDNNNLKIVNTSGGSITIVNVQNDASGFGFGGSSSTAGVPLNTGASTDSKIKLERNDGDAIYISDVTGTTTQELGVYSVQNGHLPIGMVVENWNTKGNTYTVDTIADRDNLAPIYPSDSVMVLDSGNGEWAYYMWINDEWIIMQTQDSATVDSKTLTTTITPANAGTTYIGTVSDGSRIINVSVVVKIPFDGTPIISVGDDLDNERIMTDDMVDLAYESTYGNTPSYVYDTGSDVDLNFYLTLDGATVGELEVIISYS